MTNDYLLKFWAKTSHDKPNAFHPLVCHLIDVAAVAETMWREVLPTATKERVARAFGETEMSEEVLEKIGRLVACIAGLHDLGKCSPPFALRGKQIETQKENLEKLLARQANKTSEYAVRLHKKLQTINFLQIYEPTDFRVQGAVPPAGDAPHGYVTAIELPGILAGKRFGFKEKIANQIGVLIGGHHGVFPNSDWRKNGKHSIPNNLGNEHWAKARIELAEALTGLLNVKPVSENQPDKLENGTIMILAGLVSVADWLGSDEHFFKCEVDDFNNIELKNGTLEKYLKHAETKATEALEKLGWRHWAEAEKPKDFGELFPKMEMPRRLQSEAIEIAGELKSPGIVVIESPMGEGKTEAAMFLADAWNFTLNQRGIYFALPTQATSNQMFGRVKEFLGERFDKNFVQLQLLHGHSSLSAEFETLQKDFKQKIQDVYEECLGDECVPHVVAAEWFTYRKRGLLAPYGVGTVDQALMAVLQTKHVFVRLFGLAHKTVIIDEVHAYDAYMSALLERLLEWLAALGSPVILLSATLPKKRRNVLVQAYQLGFGINESNRGEGEDVYPRISYATDATIKVRHIESSTKTQTLHIKKASDENFIADLKAKLKSANSGCVAIICNTVKRSQDIYEQLSRDEFFKGDANDGLPKLDLLHSRFRFCDRDRIESRVRLRFGKASEKVKFSEDGKDTEKEVKRPDFAVLVSTQIIEQSLDLDFDLMISDLAPADLLLQRAGRLHRHERTRKDEFEDATLWIIEPKLKDDGTPNFENSIVYDKHILLRTWLELRKKKYKKIKIPTEIEELIEAVYDNKRECFDENFTALWDETKIAMTGKLKAKRLKAKTCRITDSDDEDLFEIDILNLDEDNPEIHKTLQALTRDDEMPSVSIVVLTDAEAANIDPKAKPDKELSEFLLKRETKISKKGLTNLIVADKNLKPKNWKNSALLRHHRLLRLDENNETILGNFKISLDARLGIVIEKTGDKNE